MFTELIKCQHRSNTNKAVGKLGQDDLLAPKLLLTTDNASNCEEVSPSNLPKLVKIPFANKKERDTLFKEELFHIAKVTDDR